MLTSIRGDCAGDIVMRFRIAASIAIAMSAPACADPWLQRPVLKSYRPARIALPDFVADTPAETELATSLSRTIASDLKQVGAFELVDQVALLNKTVTIDVPPEFADWRRTTTGQLVVGRVARQADDRIKVEFRLWDVSSGRQLAGQQYIGNPVQLRDVGHLISGDIYQGITNETRRFE